MSEFVAPALCGWDRYQVVQRIGSGSFGVVSLCRDLLMTPPGIVAVKAVPLLATTEKESRLAMSEVAILRSLSHPNVLAFLDVFIDLDQQLCCVTEYVDGGDLSQMLRAQRKVGAVVDSFTALDIARQCLEGLAYLHSHAVLHRDLKPANLYYSRSTGTVKLGDFGVAKLLSDSDAHAVTFIGTPFYICPELCLGEPYSYGADIWALGVSLYELCTGKLPFQANNVLALAAMIAEGHYDVDALLRVPRRCRNTHETTPEDDARMEGLANLVQVLVQSMLTTDPTLRPTAQQLLEQHFHISSAAPSEETLRERYQESECDELRVCSPQCREANHRHEHHVATQESDTNSPPPLEAGSSHQAQERGQEVELFGSMRMRESLQRKLDSAAAALRAATDANSTPTEPPPASPAPQSRSFVPYQGGWATGTSVYQDPHALEARLREKAAQLHERRRAKYFADKARRTNPATERTPSATEAVVGPSNGTSSKATVSSTSDKPPRGEFFVFRPAASGVAATGRDSALGFCHTRSRTVTAAPEVLPFDPPRVHFSDEEPAHSSSTKRNGSRTASGALAAAATLVVWDSCETSSFELVVPNVSASTSFKQLLRRVKRAIRRGVPKVGDEEEQETEGRVQSKAASGGTSVDDSDGASGGEASGDDPDADDNISDDVRMVRMDTETLEELSSTDLRLAGRLVLSGARSTGLQGTAKPVEWITIKKAKDWKRLWRDSEDSVANDGGVTGRGAVIELRCVLPPV